MGDIKVINESNNNEFENKVNDLLDEGYKVSSSSCGYTECNYEYYIAILYKEEAGK